MVKDESTQGTGPSAQLAADDAGQARPQAGCVLIVDDNEVNRVVATRLLERLGYASEAVGDGGQAVDATRERSYGLVLMDCHMPVMDGYEATRRIRDRETGERHTPIVALTAHAVESNRSDCLSAGMDDFLTKPVGLAELRGALERWMPPGRSSRSRSQ